FSGQTPGRELDFAILGELRRVIEQLPGHILEFAGIAKRRAEIRRDRTQELVSVVGGRRPSALGYLLKQSGQVGLLQIQLHLSGFNFREIENLVDELQ